ncbi:MAG: Na(+)/H(+)-K(+) antiporter GerN [bacterium]|nr:Na(+)/H(+)-K(+) antiporter GerN [bacterium]
MRKNLLVYGVLIIIFGVGISFILEVGSRLHPGQTFPYKRIVPSQETTPTPLQQSETPASHLFKGLLDNLHHPLSILLLQIIVIIAAARLFGALFQKIGQPAVIGEMIAGILLGPSLLGMLSPGMEAFLFPEASMGALRLLSQIGVILFMFVVGIELNLQYLRQKAHAAVLVSHVSIVVPFFLGVAFSLLVYNFLAAPHVSFIAFALFIGIAMSITAFPVLARIIEERGLAKSYLGSTAIACAAVDDVTAWCLLAVVVAIAKASGLSGAVLTISLSLGFIGIMLLFVKPSAGRLMDTKAQNAPLGKGVVASVLIFVFAAALFTEVIGIHALFGAFLAGVAMPQHASLRLFLRERLETFSAVFLLPLFFAFTGLRTQIGLLNDWQSWLLGAGIIAIAIAGKLGVSALAARWTGMSWHDALSIGVLMNTRGLMELIVLNLGYDMGILSPRVFAMMVLMALVTTFMTGPLLALLEFVKRREAVRAPATSLAA